MDLDKQRHLRYWQRCLRSLLPHQHVAIDIHSYCDARGPPQLSQLGACLPTPGGGFAGGPTHVYPGHVYSAFDFESGEPTVGASGEANIAATLFALQLLALLGTGEGASSAFAGVNRNATLRWLRRLQRPDGSFGEFVADVADPAMPGGRRTLIAGGSDMRYCYIASMIRWMLRGSDEEAPRGSAAWVDDIDVEALVQHMRRGQTYDGGFAESSAHESHAGYAFCAIAALELLERPPEGNMSSRKDSLMSRGIADLPGLIRWLSARTFLYSKGEENDDDNDDEWQESIVTEVTPSENVPSGCLLGFNGRCNKHADSCYTWWTLGSMAILTRNGLVDNQEEATQDLWGKSRRFLLTETQHLIGGFSKTPGGPPDIYHSYLGLAALATNGDPALKPFDPAMSISLDTVHAIEAARRGLLRGLGAAGEARRLSLLAMGRACWV